MTPLTPYWPDEETVRRIDWGFAVVRRVALATDCGIIKVSANKEVDRAGGYLARYNVDPAPTGRDAG